MSKIETINISDICYEFIEENKELFDLKQYDVDHSLNFELLEKYVNEQTCSKEFFELVKYIYNQSTYITCDAFIEKYTNNVNELNTTYGDKEIIVIFPYLGSYKSNFFLTLYFLDLYNKVLSKKIKYVFPFVNKLDNIINVNELSLSGEPLFVVCDDFIYSGSQLSTSIARLPIIDETDKEREFKIYPCIVGMTTYSSFKFNKETMRYLVQQTNEFLNSIGRKSEYNNNYNVIFPKNIFYIEKTLKTVLIERMLKDGYSGSINDKQIYDYIRLHDMYLLEVKFDKLYAIGQFSKLYYDLDNTLIYLFFKYPDYASTILSMCVLNQYDNSYVLSKDKLVSFPYKKNPKINQFEITQDFFNEHQDLEELQKNIKNKEPVNLEKFNWLEKCNPFPLNDIKKVKVNGIEKIELIRNLKDSFRIIDESLCNYSIETFYKRKELENIFNKLQTKIETSLNEVENRKKSEVGGRKSRKVLKKRGKKKNKTKRRRKHIK